MSSPPPPKRPPMFLVLGIILAIVGMIVMLKSADNLAGVVGILFTIFGVIINLLQLYIPMPLFPNTSSSAPAPQPNPANPQKPGLLQVFNQYLASLPFALSRRSSLQTADKTFLWACFILIPIIVIVRRDFANLSLIGWLATSGVGLLFLISNLRVKKNHQIDIVGGILLTIIADILFFSSFFLTHLLDIPRGQHVLDVFQLSGELFFLMFTLMLVLGSFFLCRYAKASLGAIWGAILIMIGILLILAEASFLSIWASLVNIGTGIAIFLATRGR